MSAQYSPWKLITAKNLHTDSGRFSGGTPNLFRDVCSIRPFGALVLGAAYHLLLDIEISGSFGASA